jgi:hypothetical protein
MVSKKIIERASVFVQSVNGLSVEKASVLIDREINELRGEYKVSTLRTILTQYRKVCVKSHKHLYTIELDEQLTIESKTNNYVIAQNRAQQPIKNASGLISRATELLSSGNALEVACALALLSGRRTAEILSSAKFSEAREVNMLHFVGQAKTKGKRDSEVFKIYCLCDSKEAVEALAFIRAKLGFIDKRKANVNYNKRLNQITYKYFNEFLGDCSTKDLRKAYATICIDRFKSNKQSVSFFLSDILGHEKNNTKSTNNYQKYYLEK